MAYQVLLVIAPLITMPYISRALGSSSIGTVSFVESISSYFVLFATMGITTYGQREISYCQDNKVKRSEIFWNTKTLECITSIVTLAVYIVFALFQEDRAVYLVLALNIVAVFFDVTWFFQGMEEFGLIVIRNIIIKILQIIYFFIFIRSPKDIVLYAFGLGVFTALGNLSLWGRLRKYISFVELEKIHPFADIKVVFSLFIPTIAVQIYTVLDKTMIGVITKSSIQNGYYEQASKISKLVLLAVTSLGAVMIPRIGYYFGKNDKKAVNDLMYKSYRFVFFLGIPLCFGLISCADNFVPWFLGPDFIDSSILIKILSLLILAIGINNVTGMQYLIPTKRQNIFTKTVLLGAATNFILNSILIYFFQAVGAAIASVAAETVIAVSQLIIVRSEISVSKIIKSSRNYLVAGICMLIELVLIGKNLSSSIVHTIIMIICGAGLYFVILLIEKDEFFVSESRNLVQKVIRKK